MSPLVPVYSIAKPYTAAAVLLTFPVEERIGELIPDLPEPITRLTVGDLLSHRSGLGDYYAWPDYQRAVSAREEPWPTSRIIARAEMGQPGVFAYSNIGYLLLRMALEHAHDRPLFAVLDDLILSPLGIEAQPFADPDDWRRVEHPGVDDDLRAYHPGWVYPGTFVAEPTEAARGMALMMTGALGAALASSLRIAHPVGAPQSHPMSPEAGYGLGLMISGSPVEVVGHGDQGPGFTLFAAASADGSRWYGEALAAEGEDLDLIRRCVQSVRGSGEGEVRPGHHLSRRSAPADRSRRPGPAGSPPAGCHR